MTHWKRDIPEDAIERIEPLLEALEQSFRPLTRQLEHRAEPATILSESSVLGE